MDTCSKCGAELDTRGNPRWCKACRAKYKRDYEATREDLAERRGFAAGVDALRCALMTAMAAAPPAAMLQSREIARWIATTPRPVFPQSRLSVDQTEAEQASAST